MLVTPEMTNCDRKKNHVFMVPQAPLSFGRNNYWDADNHSTHVINWGDYGEHKT